MSLQVQVLQGLRIHPFWDPYGFQEGFGFSLGGLGFRV